MDRIPFQATSAGALYERIAVLPVAILLDNVRSMYNVGAFFRTGDAARIEKLCLCGITGYPPKHAISKTALGAEETVPWEHSWEPVPLLRGMRERGYEIAAVETTRTRGGPVRLDAALSRSAWSSATRWTASGRKFRRCAIPTSAFPCWAPSTR